jgi:hypothetical protein
MLGGAARGDAERAGDVGRRARAVESEQHRGPRAPPRTEIAGPATARSLWRVPTRPTVGRLLRESGQRPASRSRSVSPWLRGPGLGRGALGAGGRAERRPERGRAPRRSRAHDEAPDRSRVGERRRGARPRAAPPAARRAWLPAARRCAPRAWGAAGPPAGLHAAPPAAPPASAQTRQCAAGAPRGGGCGAGAPRGERYGGGSRAAAKSRGLGLFPPAP